MTALLHELRDNPLLWLLVYLIFAMTLYLLPPRAQRS